MTGPKNAIADKGAADGPLPMPDGKVDLPNGQYAILETRPTHGEYKKLFAAIVGAIGAEPADKLDVMTEVVEVLLKEWTATDREGQPLGRTRADIERCPQETLIPVFDRGSAIFKAIPVPKT